MSLDPLALGIETSGGLFGLVLVLLAKMTSIFHTEPPWRWAGSGYPLDWGTWHLLGGIQGACNRVSLSPEIFWTVAM